MSLLTLLAAWLAMAIAPKTRVGLAVRRGLVETPAKWLNGLGRGHAALALLLAVVGVAMLWFGGGDGM